ncbi:class I SAM-dependent methyltransferase [Brevibacillus centrosporus]|uniref:class I SAM-dependent methyltransferase n=1 Tax=Brevibacillus centrosporus TaxID=54910 RepID=UPI0011415BCD|nr:class I SAM-dependent methyltransferase [Brevibacillus centrosporus]MEC2130064.1 class I SAM-dependent methyltransferase [Brevibacillus centrosporus]GED32445.1 hypothetical protein BCE02nite_35860 [Brevibacillus centrosporus]
MRKGQKDYIPALSYQWLTKLYDPLVRWTMREFTFKSQLVKELNTEKGNRVLDLGCGTATLTIQLKQAYPESNFIGLDGDRKVLSIAKKKVSQAGLEIDFQEGLSYNLPYPDETFDHIVSSLLFHHLTSENKKATFDEVYRVLKPGGEFHLADWGKPQNQLMRIAFLSIQVLDGFTTTKDHVKGKLPEFINHSGFHDVKETSRFVTIYGTLSLYRAKKPT